MYLTSLKVGAAIHLDVDREGEKFTFPAKVESVSKDCLSLLYPYYCGSPFVFREEDKLAIRYMDGSQLLRWKVLRYETKHDGILSLLVLYTEERGEGINRRAAYRVAVNEPMTIKPLVGDPVEVFVRDISLEGLGFTSDRSFEVGDEFTLKLATDDGEVRLDFRIVRVVVPAGSEKDFRYGAMFLSPENRILSRYIIERQRKELQRRRLVKGV